MLLDLVLAALCVLLVLLLARRSPAAGTALLLLLALVVVLPPVPHALADDHVTVAAAKGFVRTHVKVTSGQVIHVKATGRVSFLKGVEADPNGYPARYSGCGGPGMCGSLSGRIEVTGAPFLLGCAGVVSAPAAGELQLSVNDYDARDNKGAFSVRVWTSAAGTAPTVPQRPGGVVPVPTGVPGTWRTVLLAALCAAAGAVAGRQLGQRRAAQAV
jgi:hypothetical protein